MERTFTFTVNGRPQKLDTEPNRSLLEVLREDLGLTGTKYGCGEGQCGACTVLVDGEPTFSCMTPITNVDGEAIQTIEGLSSGEGLHLVQEAFLTENAFQCGYCTPGMILAVVGMLKANPRPTEAEIESWLEEHLCRCCGYPAILAAVRRVVSRQER
jgi:aerobic-type carbon monoxide dehydrogenase small subunit (CoxS/CutS family)